MSYKSDAKTIRSMRRDIHAIRFDLKQIQKVGSNRAFRPLAFRRKPKSQPAYGIEGAFR